MSSPDPVLDPEATEAAPVSRKKALLVFAAVFAAIIVLFAVALAPKGTPSDGVLPADPVGFAAPDFTLPALDGSGDLSLSDYAGKPVLLNFWASWCTTCKAEAQALADAQKRWSDYVVFLGVDTADKDDEARAYEKEYGVEYASGVDPDSQVAASYRVTGYPESCFITPDGRIQAKFISSIDAVTLDSMLSELTGQPVPVGPPA